MDTIEQRRQQRLRARSAGKIQRMARNSLCAKYAAFGIPNTTNLEQLYFFIDRDDSKTVNFVEINASLRSTMQKATVQWQVDQEALSSMLRSVLHAHGNSLTKDQWIAEFLGTDHGDFNKWMQYVLAIAWPREQASLAAAAQEAQARIREKEFERFFVAKTVFFVIDDDQSGKLEGREITLNRWLKVLLSDGDRVKMKDIILRNSDSSDSSVDFQQFMKALTADVDAEGVPKGLPIPEFERWADRLVSMLPACGDEAKAREDELAAQLGTPLETDLMANDYDVAASALQRDEQRGLQHALEMLKERCAAMDPPVPCTLTEDDLLAAIVDMEGMCEPSGFPISLAKGMPHMVQFALKDPSKPASVGNLTAEVSVLQRFREIHALGGATAAEVLAVREWLRQCYYDYKT